MKKERGPFTVLPLEIIILYVFLLVLLCTVSVFAVLRISQRADTTYGTLVSKQIYEYKRDYLKNTVENAITTLHTLEESLGKRLNDSQSAYLERLSEFVRFTRNDPDRIIETLKNIPLPDYMVFKITDDITKQIVMTNYPSSMQDGEVYIKKTVKIGRYLVEVSYTNSYFYSLLFSQVHEFIHSQQFTDDSYMWINEVHDWDGGDDYATRLVHSEFIETEGMSLSTNMKDVAGNFPYLEELGGIKKEGFASNTYFFKRNDTDEITKKITYSSLFPNRSWIVAMGAYIDDVEDHVQLISQESKVFTRKQIFYTVPVLVLCFLFVLVSLIGTSAYYINRVKRQLAKESNLDYLTNIYNRKIGEEHLLVSFYEYKKTESNQFVFLIDIDNFKSVNDTYGHTAGDIVLKRIVKIIEKEARETDAFFRWGGEEFLLVCKDLEIEHITSFAQRLLDSVSRTPIPITYSRKKKQRILEQKKLRERQDIPDGIDFDEFSSERAIILYMSISIGISCFSQKDANYQECFRRADLALNESKNTGKGKYTIVY